MRFLAVVLVLGFLNGCGDAASHPEIDNELRVDAYLSGLAGDSVQLREALSRMPKGGDLHTHLAGAIYAESMIAWAAEEKLCIASTTLALSPAPCGHPAERLPADRLLTDTVLRNRAIDAWSMRNWQPGGESGHDHFFATFDKYLPAMGPKMGEMLAEVTSRAAENQVSYLELMITPDEGNLGALGMAAGWSGSVTKARTALEAAGIKDSLGTMSRALDRAEVRRRSLQQCDTPQAAPGCGVTVRYLYQVLRGLPAPIVFAQILAGFEWTGTDARVVGVNLVMPEDAAVPMNDFSLHMAILDSLHRDLPSVSVTLHAGELNQALVKGSDFGSHIRRSVLEGHAKRIGHGVALSQEEDRDGLLRLMAEQRVLVEIALTSNDFILGVTGSDHPLAEYLKNGVPTALATDDEGVSRSNMTNEFVRAVQSQHLNYRTLKGMVRNSLEYSFAAGKSLWADYARLVPVAECVKDFDDAACRRYAGQHLKADLERNLELSFQQFESELSKKAATTPR